MKTAARIAAMLATGSLPFAVHALDCPAGHHPKKLDGYKIVCEVDDYVADVASLRSPAQLAEKQAWEAFNKALASRDKALGQFDLAKSKRDAAQRHIDNANCGQFQCNTQTYEREVNQHEREMDAAENAMGSAVDACNGAAAAVNAARAQEKAANEKSVSLRSPTCPAKPGQSTVKCREGTHMYRGKCVKR